jgi:hypothetical protein
VLLAKGADIGADDGGLVLRDLVRTAAPTGHHAPACQMTLYELKVPGVRAYVPDYHVRVPAFGVQVGVGIVIGHAPQPHIACLNTQTRTDDRPGTRQSRRRRKG